MFSSVSIEHEVSGISMLPTYNDNVGNQKDIVYVNTFDHDYAINDIIVFTKDKTSIIKRVIGLPGDIIDIVSVNNEYRLERNGKIIQEDYIYIDDRPTTPSNNQSGLYVTHDNFTKSLMNSHPELFNEQGKLVVPEISVFVLGDNRHRSEDSSLIGTISFEQIEGKVELVRRYNESQFDFYWDYIVTGKFFKTLVNIF